MKKAIAILLSVVMVFGLSGCQESMQNAGSDEHDRDRETERGNDRENFIRTISKESLIEEINSADTTIAMGVNMLQYILQFEANRNRGINWSDSQDGIISIEFGAERGVVSAVTIDPVINFVVLPAAGMPSAVEVTESTLSFSVGDYITNYELMFAYEFEREFPDAVNCVFVFYIYVEWRGIPSALYVSELTAQVTEASIRAELLDENGNIRNIKDGLVTEGAGSIPAGTIVGTHPMQ